MYEGALIIEVIKTKEIKIAIKQRAPGIKKSTLKKVLGDKAITYANITNKPPT